METWAAELAGDASTGHVRKESEATSFASLEAGCTSNASRSPYAEHTAIASEETDDAPEESLIFQSDTAAALLPTSAVERNGPHDILAPTRAGISPSIKDKTEPTDRSAPPEAVDDADAGHCSPTGNVLAHLPPLAAHNDEAAAVTALSGTELIQAARPGAPLRVSTVESPAPTIPLPGSVRRAKRSRRSTADVAAAHTDVPASAEWHASVIPEKPPTSPASSDRSPRQRRHAARGSTAPGFYASAAKGTADFGLAEIGGFHTTAFAAAEPPTGGSATTTARHSDPLSPPRKSGRRRQETHAFSRRVKSSSSAAVNDTAGNLTPKSGHRLSGGAPGKKVRAQGEAELVVTSAASPITPLRTLRSSSGGGGGSPIAAQARLAGSPAAHSMEIPATPAARASAAPTSWEPRSPLAKRSPRSRSAAGSGRKQHGRPPSKKRSPTFVSAAEGSALDTAAKRRPASAADTAAMEEAAQLEQATAFAMPHEEPSAGMAVEAGVRGTSEHNVAAKTLQRTPAVSQTLAITKTEVKVGTGMDNMETHLEPNAVATPLATLLEQRLECTSESRDGLTAGAATPMAVDAPDTDPAVGVSSNTPEQAFSKMHGQREPRSVPRMLTPAHGASGSATETGTPVSPTVTVKHPDDNSSPALSNRQRSPTFGRSTSSLMKKKRRSGSGNCPGHAPPPEPAPALAAHTSEITSRPPCPSSFYNPSSQDGIISGNAAAVLLRKRRAAAHKNNVRRGVGFSREAANADGFAFDARTGDEPGSQGLGDTGQAAGSQRVASRKGQRYLAGSNAAGMAATSNTLTTSAAAARSTVASSAAASSAVAKPHVASSSVASLAAASSTFVTNTAAISSVARDASGLAPPPSQRAAQAKARGLPSAAKLQAELDLAAEPCPASKTEAATPPSSACDGASQTTRPLPTDVGASLRYSATETAMAQSQVRRPPSNPPVCLPEKLVFDFGEGDASQSQLLAAFAKHRGHVTSPRLESGEQADAKRPRLVATHSAAGKPSQGSRGEEAAATGLRRVASAPAAGRARHAARSAAALAYTPDASTRVRGPAGLNEGKSSRGKGKERWKVTSEVGSHQRCRVAGGQEQRGMWQKA